MNSLIVISWVAMGAFAAWIATHLVKDRSLSPSSGIGNLAVGVLGALLGGLAMQSALHGRHGYTAFTFCAGGALTLAALLIGITRYSPRGLARSHRARTHVS